jgi:hypothetical protein
MAAVRKARADNPDRRKTAAGWASYKAAINKIIELYGPGPYWGSGLSVAEIKAERDAALAAGVLTPRDAANAGKMPPADVISTSSISPVIILGIVALAIFFIFRKR